MNARRERIAAVTVGVLMSVAAPAADAALVSSFPAQPVTGTVNPAGTWFGFGSVQFAPTSPFLPTIVGDAIGSDTSDVDGDLNLYAAMFGNPWGDADLLVSSLAAPQDAVFSWTGCIPLTWTSQQWVGLSVPNPAFTGAANSYQGPHLGTDFGFSTVFTMPGQLTFYRAIQNQVWTPIDPAFAPALNSNNEFCADYAIVRSSGTITAFIDGNLVYSGPSEVPTSPLMPYAQSFDSPITFSSIQFSDSFVTPYDFDGFYAPVSPLPHTNVAKAGRAIPLKFSLGGDMGLDVIEPGYPTSFQVLCDTNEATSTLEPTDTAGSSGLSYDAASDTYTYIWKTDSSWDGQCRMLVLKLDDGSEHMARFRFR